jgi:DNA-binding NarL/FixJ family response regulator
MLTTFDVDDYVYAALRAGASGFLLKDAPADELIRAVRVVAAGDALLAPSVTRRVIADLVSRHAVPRRSADELARLTPRETEVLALLARGMSNAEIAAELVVSEETVKTHVGRIFSKLGLRDRAQAVVIAYESGLVSPFARSVADEPRTDDAGRIGVHGHARNGIDHADRSSHRWR